MEKSKACLFLEEFKIDTDVEVPSKVRDVKREIRASMELLKPGNSFFVPNSTSSFDYLRKVIRGYDNIKVWKVDGGSRIGMYKD